MTAKSDYGKAVAEAERDLQRHVINTPDTAIDPSVKEQVLSDLEKCINHHEGKEPFPVIAVVGTSRA